MSNQISWDHEFSPDRAREWGDFVRNSRWHWRWWMTFTFQKPVSQQSAMEVFKRWASSLAKGLRQHLVLSWVLDTNGGHNHFHFLLSLPPDSVNKAKLKQSWLDAAPGITGHECDIEAYDPKRGAAYYLGKKLKNEFWGCDTVCSRRPCCRRKANGCCQVTSSSFSSSW
jgi:hypothetical protein